MTGACSFHRERSGLWDCPECGRVYCGECIPGGEDNFSGGEPRCPLCTKSLQYRGGGVEAAPFWRRGPELLRYGVRPRPLGVAMLAALLFLVGLSSLITLVLLLLGYLVLVSYGLDITMRMAQGDWDSPRLGQAYRNNRELSLKQLALFVIILGIPVAAVITGSPVLGGLLFVLAMMVMPAAVMILALSECLADAINPVMQWRVMQAVGWPYLLLWLALSAVTAAPDLVLMLVGDAGMGLASVFLVNVVAFDSLLIAYALMGYLLYQYGGELGLAGQQRRGRSLPPAQYRRKSAQGLSHIYAQQGRLEDALDAINTALAGDSGDLALRERKHRLLTSLEDKRKLTRHGREYCQQLAAAGNPGNATSVLKDIWQLDPDFRLENPSASLAIARVFFQQRRFREVRHLLVHLHRDHPAFEQLGEAYLLLARVYLEGFDSPDHARRILGFLQKNRPEALTTDEGRTLRALIADSGRAASGS